MNYLPVDQSTMTSMGLAVVCGTGMMARNRVPFPFTAYWDKPAVGFKPVLNSGCGMPAASSRRK